MKKIQLVLKTTLTELYITSGFEHAGIWPFNAKRSLKSLLLINNKPPPAPETPAKYKRGHDISGKVLTPTNAKKPVPKKPRKTKATTTQVSVPTIIKV